MRVKMVVLFTEWCPKSNMMLPLVDDVEKYFGENLRVVRVDADQNPEAMVYYECEVVPTFIFYKDGQEVSRMAGMIGEKVFFQRIAELFSKNAIEAFGEK